MNRELFSWFQTFAVFWKLYAFFWVIPRRLNFISRRFGTLCLFHLHRRIGMITIRLWRWKRQSVPKRRHIKFGRRIITQKKAYNRELFIGSRIFSLLILWLFFIIVYMTFFLSWQALLTLVALQFVFYKSLFSSYWPCWLHWSAAISFLK